MCLNPITGSTMVLSNFRKNNLTIASHHLGEESKQLHCVHSRVRGSGRGQRLSWVPWGAAQSHPAEHPLMAPLGFMQCYRAQRLLPQDLLSQHKRWLCKHGPQVVFTELPWKILPGYVNNHLNRENSRESFSLFRRDGPRCRVDLHLYNQELPLHPGKNSENWEKHLTAKHQYSFGE